MRQAIGSGRAGGYLAVRCARFQVRAARLAADLLSFGIACALAVRPRGNAAHPCAARDQQRERCQQPAFQRHQLGRLRQASLRHVQPRGRSGDTYERCATAYQRAPAPRPRIKPRERQQALGGKRRHDQQDGEPVAVGVGAFGHEPAPDGGHGREYQARGHNEREGGAGDAFASPDGPVRQEHADADQNQGRNRQGGQVRLRGDAGQGADAEQVGHRKRVARQARVACERRQPRVRALAAQKRQRGGDEHHHADAYGKHHGGGEAPAAAQAPSAQAAVARQLVEEPQHAQQAHHIPRVPVEHDSARARGEQPAARAALHQAIRAQRRQRGHDHAVEPHDVARIPQHVRGERVGACKQHQQRLPAGWGACRGGARLVPAFGIRRQKPSAQKHQAAHGARGDLHQVQDAEQLRHGFRREEERDQVERAGQVIGEQAEHPAAQPGGVAVQQVALAVQHLDEPAEVLGVLHGHVVEHHRHVAEGIDPPHGEGGQQHAEGDGEGGKVWRGGTGEAACAGAGREALMRLLGCVVAGYIHGKEVLSCHARKSGMGPMVPPVGSLWGPR